MKKMKYSCEEHIDWALEEVVAEKEEAPILELCTEEEKKKGTCSYCPQPATYKVL